MRFILKTVREQEMDKAPQFGFVDGVFLSRAEAERTGRHYDNLIRSSLKHPYSMIGIELKALSSEQLATELSPYQQMDPARIIAFVPMTIASLQLAGTRPAAVRIGVQHAVTLLQSLASAHAGAHILFFNASHFHAMSVDLAELIVSVRQHLRQEDGHCEVWVDDAPTVAEANRIAALGVDALVMTWNMLREVVYHPLTDRAIVRALTPWVHPGAKETK